MSHPLLEAATELKPTWCRVLRILRIHYKVRSIYSIESIWRIPTSQQKMPLRHVDRHAADLIWNGESGSSCGDYSTISLDVVVARISALPIVIRREWICISLDLGIGIAQVQSTSTSMYGVLGTVYILSSCPCRVYTT